jgi:hypothetical protein
MAQGLREILIGQWYLAKARFHRATPPYPNAWWNRRVRKYEQRDTIGPSLVGIVFMRTVPVDQTMGLNFDRFQCLSVTTTERGELASGLFLAWNLKDSDHNMAPSILEIVRIRPNGSYVEWGEWEELRLDDLFESYSVDLESLPGGELRERFHASSRPVPVPEEV